MTDHHSDHEREHEPTPREGAEEEASTGPRTREADPAEDPGPRGNQDVDSERLEREEEDAERTLGH
jgi:hypothetical protein